MAGLDPSREVTRREFLKAHRAGQRKLLKARGGWENQGHSSCFPLSSDTPSDKKKWGSGCDSFSTHLIEYILKVKYHRGAFLAELVT